MPRALARGTGPTTSVAHAQQTRDRPCSETRHLDRREKQKPMAILDGVRICPHGNNEIRRQHLEQMLVDRGQRLPVDLVLQPALLVALRESTAGNDREQEPDRH
eukprot:7898346-Pyramimonas_sp.AAC.1